MMLSRRRLLVTTAAIGAAPALGRAQTKPKPAGQVVIGLSQEPTVFDPRRPHIEVDDGVNIALYSPLWAVAPSGEMLPRLALEVPTVANGGLSADGLTWSIKLRPGVKWHDGTPFTSADVAFSLQSMTAKDFPAYSRTGHSLVENIQTPAPDRITWTMKKPYAPYLSILSWFFIMPKHKLENEPLVGGHYAENPVGTGPFKWKERVPGDHITLVANEDYFGDGPILQTAVFKYIPDLTVLYTQYRTGDIDFIGLQGISADHYDEAKKLPDRVVTAAPTASIENFYFNLGLPQFAEKAVRQAIYYAYDKDSIVQQLYFGVPTPTESYLPQQSWAYNPGAPEARVQHRQSQGHARRRRLEARPRRHPHQERRPPRLHQFDHRRQPSARAGATTPAAGLQVDRRRDDDQEPASGRDVERLLGAVQVRDRDRRH